MFLQLLTKICPSAGMYISYLSCSSLLHPCAIAADRTWAVSHVGCTMLQKFSKQASTHVQTLSSSSNEDVKALCFPFLFCTMRPVMAAM